MLADPVSLHRESRSTSHGIVQGFSISTASIWSTARFLSGPMWWAVLLCRPFSAENKIAFANFQVDGTKIALLENSEPLYHPRAPNISSVDEQVHAGIGGNLGQRR